MESLPAASGEWLRPLVDAQWHDMHAVVPRGFPAYARIFHPVTRDFPADTGTWHDHELPAAGEVTNEQVSWSDVSEAFGKEMHALAQFDRLLGPETPRLGPLDSHGRRYSKPETGNLAHDILAAVASQLCEHTATPDDGVTAIWDGWGGLTHSAGFVQLSLAADGESSVRSAPVGELGSGILPTRAIETGTLDLPGRSYYLFSTGARLYTTPGWIDRAPWQESSSWPQSPNVLWPADRSWVVVSEIDFDSTVIAGSWDLITALAQDPSIEALVLREGADLSWDADALNR